MPSLFVDEASLPSFANEYDVLALARELTVKIVEREEAEKSLLKVESKLAPQLNFNSAPLTINIGIDEAGRGCVAGSMFIAGALECEGILENSALRDSKKIKLKQRAGLSEAISSVTACVIIEAKSELIDALGISALMNVALTQIIAYFDTLLAPIIKALGLPVCYIFDGNTRYNVSDVRLSTLIKGDEKLKAISAASILAKSFKDKEMSELDRAHKGYGFASHMGYLTSLHKEALGRLGPIKGVHRESFRGVL